MKVLLFVSKTLASFGIMGLTRRLSVQSIVFDNFDRCGLISVVKETIGFWAIHMSIYKSLSMQ